MPRIARRANPGGRHPGPSRRHAGATGSRKSVGLPTFITGLLYSVPPELLKFVMIDPKKIELAAYGKLQAHYVAMPPEADDPIITDFAQALGTLKSCEKEMESRYDLLSAAQVRSIREYTLETWGGEEEEKYLREMWARFEEIRADPQRWRARLRAEVLPALKDLRHDAGIKAVEAGRQLRQAAAVIDRRIRAIAEDVVADEGTSRWLNRVDARAISQGELTALLRREAVALSVPADRLPARLLNEIASAARSNSGETRRFELARGGRIVVDAEHLTVHGPDDADGA